MLAVNHSDKLPSRAQHWGKNPVKDSKDLGLATRILPAVVLYVPSGVPRIRRVSHVLSNFRMMKAPALFPDAVRPSNAFPSGMSSPSESDFLQSDMVPRSGENITSY